MKLIRDLENYKIYLVDDNDNKVLELGFFADEFIISLYTNQKIIITEQIDKYFYFNLQQIMNQNYYFDNTSLSYKKENEIRWFSDQYCDVEDVEQTSRITRLIIKEEKEQFQIYCQNPFFEKEKINIPFQMVSFSSGGNGFYSKNVDTGSTFQNDMVSAFIKTLNKKCDIPKKKYLIKKYIK